MKRIVFVVCLIVTLGSYAQTPFIFEKTEFKQPVPSGKIEIDEEQIQFKDYGDLWFSTLDDLVDIGVIEFPSTLPGGTPLELFAIFPDSTIIAGEDALTNEKVYANLHGFGEMINPSLTPSGWADEWTKIVIDSVEIPFVYIRETDETIVDTVFVDYLVHYPYLYYFPINENEEIEFGEFAWQPLFHTGNSDQLDAGQVFRTDTILLTVDDSTDRANLNLNFIQLDVNDTVKPKERYGVYVRFKPGYEWAPLTDKLSDYNQFMMVTREQIKDEAPQQFWHAQSGFCTYALNFETRYNTGYFADQLIPGNIPSAEWILEHLYVYYKLTSNELSIDDNNAVRGLKVFPNPANAQIYLGIDMISNSDIELQIFDATGKQIKRESINGVPKGIYKHQIDVSQLSSGIYTVNLNGVSRKFIVK